MKDSDVYIPRPIDTSGVQLPESLLQLTEMMARNTHEVWARERVTQGWTYGSRRDDVSKQHPCLLPYDELSEAEKNLDRATVLENLKLIYALGYRISEN